jgi:hypothetical protein
VKSALLAFAKTLRVSQRKVFLAVSEYLRQSEAVVVIEGIGVVASCFLGYPLNRFYRTVQKLEWFEITANIFLAI